MGKKSSIAKLFSGITSGIVTLRNSLMTEDGDSYSSFFCKDWRLVPDNSIDSKFKSREGWHLQGMNSNGEIGVICPGCEVLGFVKCSCEGSAKSTRFTYQIK